MKKVLGILFLILIMIATVSFGAYYEGEDAIIQDGVMLLNIPEDVENEEVKEGARDVYDKEVVYDDVYKMGENVTITEVIDGNVYAMGKTVTIDGATIYGNIYVMAEKIEIKNIDIGSSAYLMGKDVTFSGLTNDIYVLGQDVKIDKNSNIWRNIRCCSSNLDIDGSISRNVYAGSENLTISDNTVIEGTLNYVSEKEANISSNAKVSNVEFIQENIKTVEENNEINISSYVKSLLGILFKTLIVSLIVVFLVKKFKLLKRTKSIVNDLINNFGKGALVLFLTPIIAVLLMLTLIGLALGISLAVIYGVLLCIATSIASIEIAYRILLKNTENEITNKKLIGLSVLVSGIIWLIGLIPLIGAIIKFIIILIGLGIVFELIFQKNKNETSNVEIQ